MKKLMIAAAIVCAAVVSQAANAQWNWYTTGTGGKDAVYGVDGKALAENTMMYLFDAAVVDQATLLSGLRAGGNIADYTAVKTTGLTADSTIDVSDFSYGIADAGQYAFWFATVVGDNVLLSNTTDPATGSNPDPTDIGFSKPKSWSNAASKGDAAWKTGGQGWYAVPEPTSGLLLLLGVAGLALKRKRA